MPKTPRNLRASIFPAVLIAVLTAGLMAAPSTAQDAAGDPPRAGLVLELETFAELPGSAGRKMMELTEAPSGQLFVPTQEGQVWLLDDSGSVSATPFLDLTSARTDTFLTGGLPFSGLTYVAFHPEYATPGAPGFGLLYTAHQENVAGEPTYAMADIDNLPAVTTVTHRVVAEWRVQPGDPTAVDETSYREVLRLAFQDDRGNPHAIGEIAFNPFAPPESPDFGALYIAVGEGTNGETQTIAPWAQDLDNPFGKLLRINPLATESEPYSIPSDNPFVDSPGSAPEIFAYGFRDPQSFSWAQGADAIPTMIAIDIGATDTEEVNIVVPGGNYGWDALEGNVTERAATSINPTGPLIGPVVTYDHNLPSNQVATPPLPADAPTAIIGGFVYRGARQPTLDGYYVFGDLVRGRFFLAPIDEMVSALQTGQALTPEELLVHIDGTETGFIDLVNPGQTRSDTRFGIDADGELYILNKHDRTIRRLALDPDAPAYSCRGVTATIVGTTVADLIEGTAADDVIVAGGGDDTVRGLGGDDIICAGDGDDRVFGGSGNNVLVGDTGDDKLRAGGGNDTFLGGPGDDFLKPGRGDDHALGGSGDDVLRGSHGDDILGGGAGHDVMFGGPDDDVLRGAAGDDALKGSTGNDTCVGGPGANYLHPTCETAT